MPPPYYIKYQLIHAPCMFIDVDVITAFLWFSGIHFFSAFDIGNTTIFLEWRKLISVGKPILGRRQYYLSTDWADDNFIYRQCLLQGN